MTFRSVTVQQSAVSVACVCAAEVKRVTRLAARPHRAPGAERGAAELTASITVPSGTRGVSVEAADS